MTAFLQTLQGLSYWSVKLSNGRELSEIQRAFQLFGGNRPTRWLEDLVATGDTAHIQELTLHTPVGAATMQITEPHSALQFRSGITVLLTGERKPLAQIIGRVENKEQGLCRCFIWDVSEQRLYQDFISSVYRFETWRPGIAAPGALNLDAIGLRL